MKSQSILGTSNNNRDINSIIAASIAFFVIFAFNFTLGLNSPNPSKKQESVRYIHYNHHYYNNEHPFYNVEFNQHTDSLDLPMNRAGSGIR